jgi:hypothetical protein
MCRVLYTIHSCNHWVPLPAPGNGPKLRLCETAGTMHLGPPCPPTNHEHEVAYRSQGPCRDCLWKKVSK